MLPCPTRLRGTRRVVTQVTDGTKLDWEAGWDIDGGVSDHRTEGAADGGAACLVASAAVAAILPTAPVAGAENKVPIGGGAGIVIDGDTFAR